MEIQPNQPDAAIDKPLAAIKNAAAPEGMVVRLTQRLQQQATAPSAKLFWRDLFTGSALAGAWWRGAVSGAVAALLAIAAILAFHHTPTPTASANNTAPAQNPRPTATPVAESRATVCPSPAVLRVRTSDHESAQRTLLVEASVDTTAPSHPAPPLPLTDQERGLVQIARTGDPKQLATINPETEAKLRAQETAEFDKFFSPPPAESHE